MLSPLSRRLAPDPVGSHLVRPHRPEGRWHQLRKFEIPNLIELQLESFRWFIEKGLRELFDEISPIKDFTGKVMELQFLDYEFGEPKYSEEECRTKDLTFSKPLYVNVELLIKETGEIQRQRVYMGDYPWMTDQGTFVINGAERVVVSQLVRSPGVYYSELEDPAVGPDAVQRQGHPEPRRLARVRDQQQGPALGQGRPQAQDRGDDPAPRGRLRARTTRSRRCSRRSTSIPSTRSSRNTLDKDLTQTPAEALIEVYKKLRPGDPPTGDNARAAGREPVLQLPPLRPRSGRPLQVQQEARRASPRRMGIELPRESRTITREDIAAIVGHLIECNRGLHPKDDIDHLGNRRIRANGELIQNAFRIGLLRMERVVRERMTIQEIDKATPERAHQHPPGRGGDEGVLRRQPAQPVHGPDQPAGRADHQAPPVGPRARAACRASAPASTSATSTTATTAGSARSRRRKVRTSA